MADELIDIYDDNVEKIGVKLRSEVHRDGDWHKAFHCWIVADRDGERFVVFQLRGPDKSLYPDTLDITAAGHLTEGETPEEGLRELEEELGVVVDYGRLRYLGLRTEVVNVAGQLNREFDETYMLQDDRPLRDYKLQADEVSGLAEIKLEDGLRLFGGEVEAVPARATRVLNGEIEEQNREVSIADVIPRRDRYYLKVFIMAGRFFDGERHLAI